MESTAASRPARIHATLVAKTSFASQQNAVPLIRELSLQNTSAGAFENLEIEVSSEPAFVQPKTWHLARLGPGDQVHLEDRDVTLAPGLLWELSEAVTATVKFRVLSAGLEVASHEAPVELLARTEWGGTDSMPEMVAAFVTPNDPAVEKLLKSASGLLRQANLPAGLDGYQSGSPRRAGELVAAIWSAVSQLGLNYATPPASFERVGQKIRTPTHVLESGLVTCLDSTLLFAACLEQSGLHPIVVFTKGHAFVGCWLQDEQFSTVTVDDVTSLRKRFQLKEALFFETTLAVQSPPAGFSLALKQAQSALGEEHDGEFELAVDIHRARMQRIRPIPTGRKPTPAGKGGDGARAKGAGEQAPIDVDPLAGIPQEGRRREQEVAETPMTRLDRWQRKLLDLSLRNRLLNFKSSKRSIALRCPNPGLLEDRLADGKKIHILASPHMVDEAHGRSGRIHEQRHGENLEEGYALDALKRNEVVVDLPPEELDRRLVELYRTARANLQEGGSNTLFLALGFLVWRKNENKDERRYRAPLILVPVSLERKSVRSGMRLVLHDDEPRVNPTLFQMLEQDFGLKVPELSGPLPLDESGLDVRSIWNAMTRAVREQEGWEVAEEVVLSTFSFAKYLMWKDLVDRTDALKANPVVRHLIETPKEPYNSSVDFPEPHQLDRDYPPLKTFTPLPADSSQLAAVMAAAQGKDFVLVGPPGTGKSQTISNLIVQCLAEGKTVLFVSEKTAALDVVYRRLREAGLGEFCLELHSNKARKLDVLEQLRSAWEASAALDPEEWHRKAGRLEHLRSELNGFVERLHKRYRNGLTPYQAIGVVVANPDVPQLSLSWPSAEEHDRDALDQLRDIAGRIDVNSGHLGGIAESAFAGVKTSEWSPSWQRELIDAAKALIPQLKAYVAKAGVFARACGLELVLTRESLLQALTSLGAVLPDAYGRSYGFVLKPQGPQLLEELRAAMALLVERREEVAALSHAYREDAFSGLDVAGLSATWAEANSAWWLRRMMLQRRVRKVLRQAVVGGKIPDCEKDLPCLARIQSLDRGLAAHESLGEKTGGVWAGLATDIDVAERTLENTERLRAAVGGVAQTPDAYIKCQQTIHRLLTDGNALLAPGAAVARAARELIDAAVTFETQNERLATLTGGTVNDFVGDVSEAWPQALEHACTELIAQEAKLNSWCAWRRVRGEAMAKGLSALVNGIESGLVESSKAVEALEVSYCRWWINAVVDRDDVLRGFVPAEHERMIEEFARLDERFVTLTCAYVRAKLCGQLPVKDEVTRSSEWGVLKRELEKKRRHKPLRQLVEEMPTALTKLTPCLLMSPLSIAQYLSPEQALFDMVVFDEASQIPVWDAVGAIARGRQAVVVGDPKQLPPTNFFERAADGGDDVEEVESDLESILDECMGANVPVRHLNWHYRSRHESLIAFSNHRYYGGGLVTFPSPVTDDRAVSYHHVSNGIYERGGARTNQAEAKALVADIIARLKDPAFARQQRTIGVVTFNTEQQRLIEDLLDEERRKDPSIEPWFAEDALEPIMIKNLESVQGDERDIIYFSITYGPDRSGHVSVHFGPLNRDGGERRLNVAITRARHELRVFATLRADKIDLARTQAVGVRDFKHFLEYAEHGPRALAEATRVTGGDYDSPFEEAVARALVERGWQVHPQVGVSSFRIDLAIVHPDAPGRYLAGVECDGATYHRSATARDRDKLREAVLRGLGWEIVRVWSTEWWTDGAGALEKLDQRLKAALEADHKMMKVRESWAEDAAVGTDCTGATAEGQFQDPVAAQGAAVAVQPESAVPAARYAHAVLIPTEAGTGTATRRDVSQISFYKEVDLADHRVDPSRFYDDDYDPQLKSLIKAVIEAEGPIRDELLVRRIARAHGLQRAGRVVRERIRRLTAGAASITREDVGEFFWPKGVQPEEWTVFREPRSDADSRGVEDVAIQELHVLARHVCEQGLRGEDALREMANRCGIRRLGPSVRARVAAAFHVFETVPDE